MMPSDCELVISRIIDAPRERVFKAWTDPELLKQWFAPLPYTTPIAELDVRPGGANLILMRDPAVTKSRTGARISKLSKTSDSSLYQCLHERMRALRQAVHDSDPDVGE